MAAVEGFRVYAVRPCFGLPAKPARSFAHYRRSDCMFLIVLRYIKPLSEVDRFVGEHRAFLERHYASGIFLLSGRQEPRTGGVILAKAESRAQIETIVRSDPFNREKIAEYELIEFLPSMSSAGLEPFEAL
jgi:uncharacterized protein YciI